MNRSKFMSAFIFGACALGYGTANADDFISFVPLVGQFDAGTPGLEIAMPFFKKYDLNSDGYIESVGVKFDVYTAGTKTLLYSTAWKYFNMPAVPAGCVLSNGFDYDFSPKFLRRSGTTRIHMGIASHIGCNNGVNWVENYNTGIYSANVSPSLGGVWVYKLDGLSLDGLDGIDTDDDGITDTLLVTQMSELGNDAANAYVVTLNPSTGAPLTWATYPVTRK